jgi:hypothetical protein
MNENQPMQEKDIPRLMNNIQRCSDERNKYINEINSILDRVKLNGSPSKLSDKPMAERKTPVADVFINDLTAHAEDMDFTNEKLANIVKRLNELI